MDTNFNTVIYQLEMLSLVNTAIKKLKAEHPDYEVFTMSLTTDFASGVSAVHFDSRASSERYLKKEAEQYQKYLQAGNLSMAEMYAPTVTPYGVVYDNGMQLSQLYDGKHLPCYHYEEDVISVGISSRQKPEDGKNLTWVYLPASKGQIHRAMERAGIADPTDMLLRMGDSAFPEEVDTAMDFRREDIYELNALALTVDRLSRDDRKKLGAVVGMAKSECASQIRHLAENLALFAFAPGAHTPAEYGKYMIQKSGHFEYDPNLDEFYDYERYGLQHMDQESGVFTDRGYIAYQGTLSLEELMADDPAEQYQREQEAGMEMGGLT